MCEPMDVYCHDTRKARKEQVCAECRGRIDKGEVYHYHHGVFDGQGVDYKECNDCYTLREKIDASTTYPDEKTAFGELYESVFNSQELSYIRTFLLNKEKRGAIIPLWMTERYDELTEAQHE